jgi:hypothetical protein
MWLSNAKKEIVTVMLMLKKKEDFKSITQSFTLRLRKKSTTRCKARRKETMKNRVEINEIE